MIPVFPFLFSQATLQCKHSVVEFLRTAQLLQFCQTLSLQLVDHEHLDPAEERLAEGNSDSSMTSSSAANGIVTLLIECVIGCFFLEKSP